MKKNIILTILSAFMIIGFTGCDNGTDDDHVEEKLYGLYGDYDSSNVFKIDTKEMIVTNITDVSPAEGAYGVEMRTKYDAYVLTRKAESIAIINALTMELKKVIDLLFKPRSTWTSEKSPYVAVSGKSKPMIALINKDNYSIEGYYGVDTTDPVDTSIYFGGGNATGHPYMLADGKRFLLLDRVNLTLSLYEAGNPQPLSQINTETTAHHVFTLDSEIDENGNGVYYVVYEGPVDENSSAAASGVMKFEVTKDNQLNELGMFHADHADGGAHHARFYGDIYIFLPTYNKTVYVIDKRTMQSVGQFEAGMGGGHITFSKTRKLAIVTNHKDTYITVADISNPTNPIVVKNIEVATPLTDLEKAAGLNTQAHTATFDDSGRFFYSVANRDHSFYEVDTDYLWISRTTYLDGNYISMGDFVKLSQ